MADDTLIEEGKETPKETPKAEKAFDHDRLFTAVDKINDRIGQVEARLQPPPAKSEPDIPARPTNERLWMEPERVMEENWNRNAAKTFGVFTANTVTRLSELAEDEVKKEFNRIYGKGAYGEVKGKVHELISKAAPEAKMNPETWRSALGIARSDEKIDQALFEKRKQLESAPPPPKGPSGSRTAPAKPEIPDGVAEYTKSLKIHGGVDFTPDQWMASSQMGNDFDTWQANKAKAKK